MLVATNPRFMSRKQIKTYSNYGIVVHHYIPMLDDRVQPVCIPLKQRKQVAGEPYVSLVSLVKRKNTIGDT